MKLTASGFFQLVSKHVTEALTALPGWKHTASSLTLTTADTCQLVCRHNMQFTWICCNSRLQRLSPRPLEAPLTPTLFSSAGPVAGLCSRGPLSLPSNCYPARHIKHLRQEKKKNLCMSFAKDTFRGLTFPLISYGPEMIWLPLVAATKKQLLPIGLREVEVLIFWELVMTKCACYCLIAALLIQKKCIKLKGVVLLLFENLLLNNAGMKSKSWMT